MATACRSAVERVDQTPRAIISTRCDPAVLIDGPPIRQTTRNVSQFDATDRARGRIRVILPLGRQPRPSGEDDAIPAGPEGREIGRPAVRENLP